MMSLMEWTAAESDGRARARAAVEDAMHARSMTVANLAAEAGVWVGTVREFLNGERWPRSRSLWKIEEALGWDRGRITQLTREIVVEGETARIGEHSDPIRVKIDDILDQLPESDLYRVLAECQDLLEKRNHKPAV